MTARIALADPKVRCALTRGEGARASSRARKGAIATDTLNDRFVRQLKLSGLPVPVREYLFAKELGRLWRFDLAWPPYRAALEIEGLVALRTRDGSDG